MEEVFQQIIIPLLSFVGGNLAHFIFYRLRKKEQRNKVAIEEVRGAVSISEEYLEMISKFTAEIDRLHLSLMEIKDKLREAFNDLKDKESQLIEKDEEIEKQKKKIKALLKAIDQKDKHILQLREEIKKISDAIQDEQTRD